MRILTGHKNPGIPGERYEKTHDNGPIENRVSVTTVVFCCDLRISVSVGT